MGHGDGLISLGDYYSLAAIGHGGNGLVVGSTVEGVVHLVSAGVDWSVAAERAPAVTGVEQVQFAGQIGRGRGFHSCGRTSAGVRVAIINGADARDRDDRAGLANGERLVDRRRGGIFA